MCLVFFRILEEATRLSLSSFQDKRSHPLDSVPEFPELTEKLNTIEDPVKTQPDSNLNQHHLFPTPASRTRAEGRENIARTELCAPDDLPDPFALTVTRSAAVVPQTKPRQDMPRDTTLLGQTLHLCGDTYETTAASKLVNSKHRQLDYSVTNQVITTGAQLSECHDSVSEDNASMISDKEQVNAETVLYPPHVRPLTRESTKTTVDDMGNEHQQKEVLEITNTVVDGTASSDNSITRFEMVQKA